MVQFLHDKHELCLHLTGACQAFPYIVSSCILLTRNAEVSECVCIACATASRTLCCRNQHESLSLSDLESIQSKYLACVQEAGYVTADKAKAEGLHELKLSGTKFRQMLRGGEDIPEWFAFKSVVNVLREPAASS